MNTRSFFDFFRALMPKPWVVTIDGAKISFATRESYFVKLRGRRAEIEVYIGSENEAVICDRSLASWMYPRGLCIDSIDREKIINVTKKFFADRGYQTRLANDADFIGGGKSNEADSN